MSTVFVLKTRTRAKYYKSGPYINALDFPTNHVSSQQCTKLNAAFAKLVCLAVALCALEGCRSVCVGFNYIHANRH